MNNPNDRTRDLPACSAVPHPTALPHAPHQSDTPNIHTLLIYNQTCSGSLAMILMLFRMMATELKDVGLSMNNSRVSIKCAWLFILFHYVHTRYDKWSAIFARYARINASMFSYKSVVISKSKTKKKAQQFLVQCSKYQISQISIHWFSNYYFA
jgi:hypothetical protein